MRPRGSPPSQALRAPAAVLPERRVHGRPTSLVTRPAVFGDPVDKHPDRLQLREREPSRVAALPARLHDAGPEPGRDRLKLFAPAAADAQAMAGLRRLDPQRHVLVLVTPDAANTLVRRRGGRRCHALLLPMR